MCPNVKIKLGFVDKSGAVSHEIKCNNCFEITLGRYMFYEGHTIEIELPLLFVVLQLLQIDSTSHITLLYITLTITNFKRTTLLLYESYTVSFVLFKNNII